MRTEDNAACMQKTPEAPHSSTAPLNKNIVDGPIKLEAKNVDEETMETEDSAISMHGVPEAHGSTVLFLNKNIAVRPIKLEAENVDEETKKRRPKIVLYLCRRRWGTLTFLTNH
ncbi:hypothetical protein QAD02_007036 [Eretmocerus hayati]|uniref:Uncharacterized protein n=1 Tax=Eretmocerus hayati TaxID=131215 RepID=A0ACC2N4Y4_9HYME|nr:hypothetical protein QAD02_007036 [Eretmocerus hayati]